MGRSSPMVVFGLALDALLYSLEQPQCWYLQSAPWGVATSTGRGFKYRLLRPTGAPQDAALGR